MISAPGLRPSTSFASSMSWRSAKMFSPSFVTTPRRSPSPSKARPNSQEEERNVAIRSCKFSGWAGSGWWFGKFPSTSQKSSVPSHPSCRYNRGASMPATPLPQSTAMWKGRASFTSPAMRRTYASSTSRAFLSGAGAELLFLDSPSELLDVFPVQRVARHHDLEAVVLRRIVAAAHPPAAAGSQGMRREVGDRVRRHADVDHVRARRVQALGERRHELRAREPSVAAHREDRRLALPPQRAERAADVAHDFGRQAAADHAADVVGPENLGWNAHKFRNSKRCWGSQPRRPGNGAARNPAWPPVRGNSSTTHGAAFRAARSRSRSGRNGSLRALSTSVGTRMCSRYGPHAAAPDRKSTRLK